MPATAELVDELRQVFGAAQIDDALVAGQQARRQFLQLQQQHGDAHATAWLRRQKFPLGSFWATERGHELGVQRP
jgi:hypothetical protein